MHHRQNGGKGGIWSTETATDDGVWWFLVGSMR